MEAIFVHFLQMYLEARATGRVNSLLFPAKTGSLSTAQVVVVVVFSSAQIRVFPTMESGIPESRRGMASIFLVGLDSEIVGMNWQLGQS